MAIKTDRDQPRTPLSRDRVLRAAIALADQGGIESLTMRKLAQELGVEAMSLYHYVTKKDDILDGINDLIVSEIEVAPKEGDWKAAIRRSAISAHQVLSRHPWACTLMVSRASPARLLWMESILGAFRKGGFSAEMTHHAYHALDSHITGFTLWLVSFQFDTRDLAGLAATFLQQLPEDEYPYLIEHIHQHLKESGDEDEGEFEFGLDLILDGLERLRDAGS